MKLITIQRIGDEERRASADLSWNDEEEKEEINSLLSEVRNRIY